MQTILPAHAHCQHTMCSTVCATCCLGLYAEPIEEVLMPSVTRAANASRPQRGQRRGQIEQRLLEATERLMAQGSTFTELSVDRLATEAGMSRRTFYVYFRDKGDLLRQLTRQVFVEQQEAAQQWWDVA